MNQPNQIISWSVALCWILSGLVACAPRDYKSCFTALDYRSGAEPVQLDPTPGDCSPSLPIGATYQIPGAMIALETEALSSPTAKIEWNGYEYPSKNWNRDQDLARALRFSVAWYFQELASLSDADRVQKLLNKMKYGKGDVARNPFMFWMTADYTVSPAGQLKFLDTFFRGETPGIKAKHQALVRDLLLQKAGKLAHSRGETTFDLGDTGGELRAKPGLLELPGERVSWLVGEWKGADRRIVFVSSVYGKDAGINELTAAGQARKKLVELLAPAAE